MQPSRAPRSLALLVALASLAAGCAAPEPVAPGGPGGGTGATNTTAPPPAGGPPGPTPGNATSSQSWEGLVLPPGVVGQVVARNLSFPTSLDWDDHGNLYVGEVGFTDAGPRILRIGSNGIGVPLRLDGADLAGGQLLDITHHRGELFFSVGGTVQAINLSTGAVRPVLDGLPSLADHRTDEIVFGPDGRLYVGQGSATNAAIMGLDQAGAPDAVSDAVRTHPEVHDVPCADVTVSGANYETTDARTANVTINVYEGAAQDTHLQWWRNTSETPHPAQGRAVTGPFAPFGTPLARGAVVPGEARCNGAVLSANPDGSDLRPAAWGFRNPFALKFGKDGKLWVSNNGYDNRGSRSVGAAPDELYAMDLGSAGTWHGWPDYAAGLPVTDPFFAPLFGPPAVKLLERDPNPPPKPVTFFSAHASANKFDWAPDGAMFVAEFGTLNVEYLLGALTGMDVVRVDPDSGRVTEFIVGEPRYGGEFRPVEARFGPDGRLYVVDFGPWVISHDPSGGLANTTGQEIGREGAAVKNTFQPGGGRVLAFRLPSGMAWEGRPAGNVGGDGIALANGTAGHLQPNATAGNGSSESAGAARVRVFEYAFALSGNATVGKPVVFVNEGREGHTATEDNGTFNSGFQLPPHGGTFTWVPSKAGVYSYYCEVHPIMRGLLRVSPAS